MRVLLLLVCVAAFPASFGGLFSHVEMLKFWGEDYLSFINDDGLIGDCWVAAVNALRVLDSCSSEPGGGGWVCRRE